MIIDVRISSSRQSLETIHTLKALFKYGEDIRTKNSRRSLYSNGSQGGIRFRLFFSFTSLMDHWRRGLSTALLRNAIAIMKERFRWKRRPFSLSTSRSDTLLIVALTVAVPVPVPVTITVVVELAIDGPRCRCHCRLNWHHCHWMIMTWVVTKTPTRTPFDQPGFHKTQSSSIDCTVVIL